MELYEVIKSQPAIQRIPSLKPTMNVGILKFQLIHHPNSKNGPECLAF